MTDVDKVVLPGQHQAVVGGGAQHPLLQAAELARAHSALLGVENTFVTPIFQRPLDLGADLMVHASTKYLGGHGDVAGGLVVGRERDSHTAAVRLLQQREGGVPSPFYCWLVQRGMKTGGPK